MTREVDSTLPAPASEQTWLPLARSGALYVSGGVPRLVALCDLVDDDAVLRHEIEILTGCTVVLEARIPIGSNSLGFTHAALVVPTKLRSLRRRRIVPIVVRRAWR